MRKPSLSRAVYGGGPKGGSWSEIAKMNTVKRLARMLVRLVLGPSRVAEYDAMMTRFDALTPEQKEAELRRKKLELRTLLNRENL